MYSEIKDNKRILINRLNDSEKILLQNMYEESKNCNLSFTELNGETGDFDGVMLEMTKIEPKDLTLYENILKTLTIYQKEEYTYIFPVDPDVEVLINYNETDKMKITSKGNVLTILANEPLEDTIKYEISKDGYKHIHGEIALTTKVRDTAKVTVNVIPSENVKAIRVVDAETGTYMKKESPIYNLPVGQYLVFVKYENNDFKLITNFEVTEEDILNVEMTVIASALTQYEACRVVFQIAEKENYGKVRMNVIEDNSDKVDSEDYEVKENVRILPVQTDEAFGIEVYHLPVGKYICTSTALYENINFTESIINLEITETDIGTQKEQEVITIANE